MREDPGNIEQITPPKIEYSVFIDYMQKISDKKSIGELPIWGLSRYRGFYNEEIFDSFDGRDHCFAYDSCDSSWNEAAQRFRVRVGLIGVAYHFVAMYYKLNLDKKLLRIIS